MLLARCRAILPISHPSVCARWVVGQIDSDRRAAARDYWSPLIEDNYLEFRMLCSVPV